MDNYLNTGDQLNISSPINLTLTTELKAATRAPDTDQANAFLYVVVVLVFYSTGIVIMLVTYIKHEQTDSEEEEFIEELFNFPKNTLAEEIVFMNKRLKPERDGRLVHRIEV